MTSLLVALLLPALRKAREAANVAVCGGNLRQMHIALHTGLIDRPSGRLPTTPAWTPVYGPLPGPRGGGDEFGFDHWELAELGWTKQVAHCPGITPETGGDLRWSFWYTLGNGGNGSDYLYTGGRSNHTALEPPRYGFLWGKPSGIYLATGVILSGTISHDDDGFNPYRVEVAPSEVTYLSDVSYNAVGSVANSRYRSYVDPSNHRDTSVSDQKEGKDLWPAIGRGSNRTKADGSVEWWNFPVKGRGKGSKLKIVGETYIIRDTQATYY